MKPSTPTMKCETCKLREAALCQQCLTGGIVVNELLCYIDTYYGRSSALMIRMAVITFYSEEEIHEAKAKLMKTVGDTIDIRDIKENRQNIAQRSAKEKEVEDILHIMKLIDEENDTTFEFLAKKLNRLPPASSEAGGSLMSLVEIIGQQTAQLMAMKTVTTTMEAQIKELTAKVKNNKKAIEETATRTTSYAAKVRTHQGSTGPAVDISIPAGGATQMRPAVPSYLDSTSKTDEANENEENSSTLGFSVVGKNGGKGPNKATATGNQRPTPNQGKAGTHNMLQAGPTWIFVQITNVRQQVTETDLSTYISEKTHGNFTELSIKDTSTGGWSTKRFLLEFDVKHMDDVLCEHFWPGKIYFKRCFPERKSKNNPLNGSNA